jgi:dCTP deaminase
MVLCDTEIRAAISSGQIIIDPPPPADHITTTAVDLTLGAEFRRWITPEGGIAFAIDPSHPSFNYHKVASKYQESVQLEADGSVVLKPHDFILGLTKERVVLPETSRLAARVEGRSRLARLGLAVHLTAPTIHAGFRGHITLEITNQGPIPIKLRPGLPVCQLIFEMVFGTPSVQMEGIFQDQVSVTGKA